MRRAAWLLFFLVACDDAGGGDADRGAPRVGDEDAERGADAESVADVGSVADAGSSDIGPSAVDADAVDGEARPPDASAPDAAVDAGPLRAAEYCERSVDVFCPYYLRCGRMAVPDLESCRATFLEACNARFEPHYGALEAAGRLRLSAEGLAACAAHLEAVPCVQQLFDLDGGCAGVWAGLGGAGASCGPGIESFVCDAEHTCVLDLDLCGECQPAVGVDEACEPGVVRCAGAAACVEGSCVARTLPGEACDDAVPCVPGASCVEGTCRGFEVVAEGQACDRARRCPYRSACVEGRCAVTPLLGEPCDPTVGCASGRCAEGICAPLRAAGEPCAASAECTSGRCDGECADLPSACLDP